MFRGAGKPHPLGSTKVRMSNQADSISTTHRQSLGRPFVLRYTAGEIAIVERTRLHWESLPFLVIALAFLPGVFGPIALLCSLSLGMFGWVVYLHLQPIRIVARRGILEFQYKRFGNERVRRFDLHDLSHIDTRAGFPSFGERNPRPRYTVDAHLKSGKVLRIHEVLSWSKARASEQAGEVAQLFADVIGIKVEGKVRS
jgi:hypothetical protein